MDHVIQNPYYFGKQESQQSIQESWNQGKIPKSRQRKFTVRTSRLKRDI